MSHKYTFSFPEPQCTCLGGLSCLPLILYSISQFFWSRVAVFNVPQFMRFTVNVLNFFILISTVHFLWVWRWRWHCCPNFSCLHLLSSVVSSFLHFFSTFITAVVIVMWLESWRRASEDIEVLCGRTSISLQLQLMLYAWIRLQFTSFTHEYKHALQCV